MSKFMTTCRALALMMAAGAVSPSLASVADADTFKIPKPDATARVGALVPYTRYDSQNAQLGGGASLVSSASMDRNAIASQASDQSYVELPGNGASAEWTMHTTGRGVTMRFTMPDTGDGMGQEGSLDVYVNGVKVKTVNLSSYWMWQYFAGGNPSDAPGGIGCFAFDEVHFLLDKRLNKGDKIKIQSSGANGLTYGVDFLEIEEVPDPIEQPDNSVSVTDFGANPDDGQDDLAAFVAAVKAADAAGKVVYIPEGTWHLGGMWNIYCKDVKITGAGMWYTNIQFTSDKAFGGGISGGNGSNGGPDGYCKNLEFCNMYINSRLRSRYNQNAVYKCFMDVYTDGSVIHDIWEDHFECGFWFGDYNGSMDYSDGVKVINCRIRNNLADGVNFCNGTSNAVVYNCSIRNNGDDGLAMWNNNYMNAKDESNNIFAYNTIDFIWRAGGIAIYGGSGHKIYNNYIRDMFMASGIHLNTTFDGYKFNNNQGITFDNNVLVHCGTNADSWNEDLAAIDLKQNVKNVTFNNTRIYNSPFYAIRTMSDPTNVTFNDTKILGTGMTGEEVSYSCVAHTAGAIRYANKNVKFNGLEVGAYGTDKKGNNSTYPFWTDNNQDLANALGATLLGEDVEYTPMDYPTADNRQQGGDVVNAWDGVEGYDLVLKALSWKNQDGSSNIKEGDKVTFVATVENNSLVDIPAKAKMTMQVMVDNSKLSLTLRDGLKAGESLTFTPTATWTATKGGHTAVATILPGNDKEANKDNNERTKRFNAYENENANNFTPVTGGYDLVVTKVFVKDLDAINPGDHLVMGAVIANAGDKDIPAGEKIGIQFQMDGKVYGTGFITWCDSYKDGLKAHATATLIANGGGGSTTGGADNYFIAEAGNHTITAWVDDTNNWKEEKDETNNKKDLSLTIPFGGTQYFENPDQPDDADNPTPEIVRRATVGGVKYELYDGKCQVAGWDASTFPEDGVLTIQKTVKMGDKEYEVAQIAGGYDNKLSGQIGDDFGAFENCDKLTAVVFADDFAGTKIGDHAFKNCKNLKSIQLPASLQEIGSWCFESTGLERIDMSRCQLRVINDGSFYHSESLKSVLFPAYTLQSIHRQAFEGTGLEQVVIPSTVADKDGEGGLGENAFYACPNLKTVTINTAQAGLPFLLFRDCANLKDLYITPSEAVTMEAWYSVSDNVSVHVVPSLVETYKAAFEAKGMKGCTVDSKMKFHFDNDQEKQAFASAYNLDFSHASGVKAYTGIVKPNEGKVLLLPAQEVPAGEGVVLIGEKAGEYEADILDAATSTVEGNALVGVPDGRTLTMPGHDFVWTGSLFSTISVAQTLAPGSAYLYVDGNASFDKFEIGFADPSGIEGVLAGQTDKADSYFTLNGVKLSQPANGINISKGKKFYKK